jgi:hypothetical protein
MWGIIIGVFVILIAIIILKKHIDGETKHNMSKLGKLLLILFGAIILLVVIATMSH